MAQRGEDDEDRLRKAQMKRLQEMQKAQELESQKREVARRFLTDSAYGRLMNVRLSSHELYDQVINLIVAMAQNRRIDEGNGKMTEEQLIGVLGKLTTKREPTMEFKHK